jgi:hypothetical protein
MSQRTIVSRSIQEHRCWLFPKVTTWSVHTSCVVYMMIVANQHITRSDPWYLSYNRLSGQNSETAIFKALKTYLSHLNFKEGFGMFENNLAWLLGEIRKQWTLIRVATFYRGERDGGSANLDLRLRNFPTFCFNW